MCLALRSHTCNTAAQRHIRQMLVSHSRPEGVNLQCQLPHMCACRMSERTVSQLHPPPLSSQPSCLSLPQPCLASGTPLPRPAPTHALCFLQAHCTLHPRRHCTLHSSTHTHTHSTPLTKSMWPSCWYTTGMTCALVSRRTCSLTSSCTDITSISPSKITCRQHTQHTAHTTQPVSREHTAGGGWQRCTLPQLPGSGSSVNLIVPTPVPLKPPGSLQQQTHHWCSDLAKVVGRWLQGSVRPLVAGLAVLRRNAAVGPVIPHLVGQVCPHKILQSARSIRHALVLGSLTQHATTPDKFVLASVAM